MDTPASQVSHIASLVGDAFGQMAKVLQTEVALAKAELARDVAQVGTNIALLAAGVLFLIPALVLLLFAFAAALIANGLSATIAYLCAGALGLVIAVILMAIGMARMKATSLVPQRTVQQLRKDREALNEVTR